MAEHPTTIVALVRDGVLDTELAALLWLLVGAGVPAHVVGPDGTSRVTVASALVPLARDGGAVTDGEGSALEDVLRQPVPLRPATGAVVVLHSNGRVAAAHFQRPPLRDAGGHVRPQAPAVLATWDAASGGWEHFAWGVIPELAAAAGERAGDFEIDHGRRAAYLADLAAAGIVEPERVAAAVRGYGVPVAGQ
jgi:hypothetical protein